jgi:hypothetical protein
VVVSDGSFSQGHGSAAWVIEGADKVGHMTGRTFVPDEVKAQSSYRGELIGLYCLFAILSNSY